MGKRRGRDREQRPLTLSPDEERLLNVGHGSTVLQRRCDLALWLALYERALADVARLADFRRARLIRLAEFGRDNIEDWGEMARSFRDIAFRSDAPTQFSLVLPIGEYGDEELIVHYELRDQRGIGVRFAGAWRQPPDPAVLPMAMRPSDAPAMAVDSVRQSMDRLRARLVPIPAPEDYAEPPPREREEEPESEEEKASRIRHEQWQARRREERRADKAAAGTAQRRVRKTRMTLGK